LIEWGKKSGVETRNRQLGTYEGHTRLGRGSYTALKEGMVGELMCESGLKDEVYALWCGYIRKNPLSRNTWDW